MKIALEDLGYDRGKGVYHMFTLLRNMDDVEMWNRALDAKYRGIGEPLSKTEWDHLLNDYEVCRLLASLNSVSGMKGWLGFSIRPIRRRIDRCLPRCKNYLDDS